VASGCRTVDLRGRSWSWFGGNVLCVMLTYEQDVFFWDNQILLRKVNIE
jgi:hypothetical protein